MALAPITALNLRHTPGIGMIGLQWELTDPHAKGLLTLALDEVEVHASQTNLRSTATQVAGGSRSALHPALVEGQTWYYWIRPRNRSGGYGDWHPSGASAGVQGTVGFAASSVYSLINGYVTASVGSNALTLAVKSLAGGDPSPSNPVLCAFPSSSVTSGIPVIQSLTSALSLTISNGSTLQTTNNIPFRLRAALFDDAGTLRLGVKRSSLSDGTIYPMLDSGIGTSVAEGGAGGADSVDVFYTAAAVTNKSYRTIAILDWDSGLAAAGAWSAGPTKVRPTIAGSMIPGSVLQEKSSVNTTVTDLTANIPADNTIPQITEGTQYFTATMMPDSAANIFNFEATLGVWTDVECDAVIALFRDSAANAIAAQRVSLTVVGRAHELVFRYQAQAGDTAARSYQMRVGPSQLGSILTINKAALGAVVPSVIAIRELAG